MPAKSKSHRTYRALLHLYPKAHQKEYGEQMVQTFDDLISEHQSIQHAVATWLRVGRELPLNIVQEHINNLEGVKMSTIRPNKRFLIVAGVVVVAALGLGIGLALQNNDHFTGTTLSAVQRPKHKPTCLQTTSNSGINISKETTDFIGNAAASSIIDVPAGTNVDVYFKTYNDAKATGSAIYSGSYGKYNFVAEKKTTDDGGYTGGWQISHFEACGG